MSRPWCVRATLALAVPIWFVLALPPRGISGQGQAPNGVTLFAATSAWAQPTIAGGRVFVGSQNGTVFSLDARTGCIYWFFSADGAVRTAMTLGARDGGGANVYFGDTTAQAYALDAGTGKHVWK